MAGSEFVVVFFFNMLEHSCKDIGGAPDVFLQNLSFPKNADYQNKNVLQERWNTVKALSKIGLLP